MKTLLFCMLGLGLTACGSSPKGTNGDQDELAMLIGTYTNGSSKGIYTFRFNQETGTAVPLSSAALPNPSYLVPSEDGEFVYAVSEMNDSTAALSSPCLRPGNGRTAPAEHRSHLRRRPLLRGHQWPGSVDCQLQRWNHVRLSFTERRHFGSCRHALSRLCHRSPTPYGKPLPTSIARSFHRTESISSPPTSVPTASCAL